MHDAGIVISVPPRVGYSFVDDGEVVHVSRGNIFKGHLNIFISVIPGLQSKSHMLIPLNNKNKQKYFTLSLDNKKTAST